MIVTSSSCLVIAQAYTGNIEYSQQSMSNRSDLL